MTAVLLVATRSPSYHTAGTTRSLVSQIPCTQNSIAHILTRLFEMVEVIKLLDVSVCSCRFRIDPQFVIATRNSAACIRALAPANQHGEPLSLEGRPSPLPGGVRGRQLVLLLLVRLRGLEAGVGQATHFHQSHNGQHFGGAAFVQLPVWIGTDTNRLRRGFSAGQARPTPACPA